MLWQSLLATLLVVPYAQALLRFGCAQLVTQRFDPLVTPGQVSPHLHQIIGGNAFNLSMDPSLDLPKISTCTTCKFKQNRSNYWTAVMYFKHSNGSFIRVPQMPNHAVGTPNGGMTVYYIQPPNGGKVTAFPKGFRMITGDPFARSKNSRIDPTSPEAYALTFRCWESQSFNDPSNMSPPGGGNYDTVEFPKKRCNGGIRANIFFPSCWDGKNTDSPDHKSHVAFMQGRVNPAQGIILFGGTCPASHPVRIPMILFETAWDTRPFNNMWPTDGSQPFVLSQGDPTGYGHHGDYLFGWEDGVLQRAMDTCTDINGVPDQCRALTTQSDAEMNKCVMQPAVNERTEGEYLRELPGCNPIQSGPGPATPVANCNAISYTGIGPPTPVTSVPGQPQPPPPASSAPGPLQTKYGQCGGQGWTGPSQCQPPYTCQVSNQWYSQCV